MSLEFILTSLIVIIIPGTGVLYTMAIGLGRGFRPSVAAAAGCTLSIVPAATASIIGLAAIFHTSALAFQIVKYLGVAYLLYMAWNILKDGGALDIEENRKPMSTWQTVMNGVLINALNPKLSLFFMAFLPQFVNPQDPHATLGMAMLAATFMLLTFLVFIAYGGSAALTRKFILSRPSIMTWMKRTFAAAFCFLGAKLALSER